jgi:hypothetical protein
MNYIQELVKLRDRLNSQVSGIYQNEYLDPPSRMRMLDKAFGDFYKRRDVLRTRFGKQVAA